jgi:hypothetical protein
MLVVQDEYDIGGDSFVVALDVETGALKLLLDDAGVPLHDATPCTRLFFFCLALLGHKYTESGGAAVRSLPALLVQK